MLWQISLIIIEDNDQEQKYEKFCFFAADRRVRQGR